MNKFTEAMDKAIGVFATEQFAKEWETVIKTQVNAGGILKQSGPDSTFAAGLDVLRKELNKGNRGALKNWIGLGTSEARAIVQAATAATQSGSFNDRAAALKMLAHLYLTQKSGGQSVWVYSPPKSYSKWVFDELAGTEKQVTRKLGHRKETYSDAEKKIMCSALKVANKWSSDAAVKLGSESSSKNVRALIHDWFGDEDTTDEVVDAAIPVLVQGFNRVSQICNSNKLIFSDEPVDRNSGGWKDWAFIYKSERLDVVYLQGAFLKAGNSGKTWKCALTIIHELTHIGLNTYDYQYDDSGLKPGKARKSAEKTGEKFNHANAMKNADSWAYFAVDLAGALSKSDKLGCLR